MNEYTYPIEKLLDIVKLAEKQGCTREEALQLLVKYNLISDDNDDMD